MCLIDPDIRSWNIPLPEHVFLPRGVESTKFGEFSIIVHLFFFFFFVGGGGGGGGHNRKWRWKEKVLEQSIIKIIGSMFDA